MSPVHGAQCWVPSQIGVVPEHCSFVVQARDRATVKFTEALGTLLPIAGMVAVTERLAVGMNSVVEVQLQLPFESAGASQITTLFSRTVTRRPGVALPAISGVVSAVIVEGRGEVIVTVPC